MACSSSSSRANPHSNTKEDLQENNNNNNHKHTPSDQQQQQSMPLADQLKGKVGGNSLPFLEYRTAKKEMLAKALADAIVPSSESRAHSLIEAMQYALSSGKRVRPILVLAACELFGGSDEQALPTAIALEMIHTMSLVHDDLPMMDDDDQRRGRPTTHKVYGEQVAILAGDALLAEAFGVVARTKGVDPTKVLQVISHISKASSFDGLAGGQVRDLECERMNAEDVGTEDLHWIHVHKTAVFLKAAVVSGGILGGGKEEDIRNLGVFADRVGLAYQVIDDILDVVGDSEELGKTVGKDEKAGKATYPSLLGLDKSREIAKNLIQEGKEALACYGDRANILLSVADFILARQS